MTTRQKVFTGLGIYVVTVIIFGIAFGAGRTDNDAFSPQEEFRLETWISLPGDLDVNKAVVYILIATLLTVGFLLYVARKMEQRPNKVQTLVEVLYTLMRDNITRNNMDEKMAAKWFPFIGTLFLFIWVSNLIGYIPLPMNTAHPVEIAGVEVPSLGLYATTANLSVPLALALIVWLSYNFEGIRVKGFVGYLKSLIPAGVPKAIIVPIFFLEIFSNFMRMVSLSVRLFANILAGHFIILFMAGALVVLLGMELLGPATAPIGIVIFLFEIVLVSTLQAFIFATLTAIYLGGAVADHH